MTRTGQPASDSLRIAASRRAGAGARGSISRDRPASSEVTEIPTRARPACPIGPRISISRSISVPLVTIVTGCLNSASTSSTCAHHPVPRFDRLVGIGIGADGDRPRQVARRRQFPAQNLGRLGPGDQPGFEIEARRQAKIGMGRTREAVDAAMLAAAIGIDRAIEPDIGRGIPGDHAARSFDRHLGSDQRLVLFDVPAVMLHDIAHRLVPAGPVRPGGTGADALIWAKGRIRRRASPRYRTKSEHLKSDLAFPSSISRNTGRLRNGLCRNPPSEIPALTAFRDNTIARPRPVRRS